MSDSPPDAVRRRFGLWSLLLGALGLFLLIAPAHVAFVAAGTAASAAAVVLGANGILAIRGGQQDDKAQAVTGIVMGAVGLLFWITAIIGVVLLG